MVPATPYSENLRSGCMRQWLSAPTAAGLHMMGATHGFNDEAVDVRLADHARICRRLGEISPALAKAMNINSLDVRQLRTRIGEGFPSWSPAAGGEAIAGTLYQPGSWDAWFDNCRPFR